MSTELGENGAEPGTRDRCSLRVDFPRDLQCLAVVGLGFRKPLLVYCKSAKAHVGESCAVPVVDLEEGVESFAVIGFGFLVLPLLLPEPAEVRIDDRRVVPVAKLEMDVESRGEGSLGLCYPLLLSCECG